MLAISPDEAGSWVDVILSLAPWRHRDRAKYGALAKDLKDFPYDTLMWVHAAEIATAGVRGYAAAVAEIALKVQTRSPTDEANGRRNRAEWLRMVDRTEGLQREPEIFPVSDRLALQEAVAEIERALLADPYDATMWNFKAAWCELLGRHEESIAAAQEAIALRPVSYPRPWINKAGTLYALGLDQEAVSCARTALEIAEAADEEFADAIPEATRSIEAFSQPRREPVLTDFVSIMRHAVGAALKTADELSPKRNTSQFVGNGIRARIRVTGSNRAISYVPMMAQLLSDLAPEVAFAAVLTITESSVTNYELCLNAAMFLAADSSGVIQRDAARFIILNLFYRLAFSAETVRNVYRQAILEVCQSGTPPLSGLDALLQAEMANFG